MNEAVLAERILRAQKDTHKGDRTNMRPTQGLGQTLGVTADWLGIWENEVPILGKKRDPSRVGKAKEWGSGSTGARSVLMASWW